MKISTLIIGYNRPQYLSQVLNSLSLIEPSEVFISIDSPKENDEDLAKVQESIKLAQYYFHNNKHLNFESTKLGCKGHVLKALDWVLNKAQHDFILVLEDDILLLDKTGPRIEEFIANYKIEEPSVLKLNDYFWGWVCHKSVLSQLLCNLDEYINEYTECYYNPGKLREFNIKYNSIFKNVNNVVITLEPLKAGIYFPWDEHLDLIMKFKGIKELKDVNKYVENIGLESSRDMSVESEYYGAARLRFYVENGTPIYF